VAFSPAITSSAIDVGMADYDGDGFADVREVSPSDIRVRFGSENGDLGQSFPIAVANAHPVAGQLTTSKLLDLAFASTEEVAVWRGQTDRTLTPTTYPSIPLPTTLPLAFVVAEVLRTHVGLEVVVFSPDQGGGFFLGVRGGDELDATILTPFAQFKQGPADLAIPLQAARFDESPGSPCDEILVAFKGAHDVNVVPPCIGDLANVSLPTVGSHRTLPPVRLPADVTVANVFPIDLNFDKHLDLFILGDEGRVFLAFGLGDGTFTSALEDRDAAAIGQPLAVGYISDDELLDFVLPNGIVIVTPPPRGPDGGPGDAGVALRVLPAPTGVNWTEAHVGDYNGNGKPDVVCASTRRIDFYNGAGGGLLNPATYSTDGTPSLLSFGDFDGDLAMDIAFRERFEAGGADGLSVMFGKAGSFPSAPVSEGRIGTISVISSGPLSNDNPALLNPGFADIGVLAKSTDGKSQFVSILIGSADRLLQSPFVLTRLKPFGIRQTPFASGAFSFAVGQFTNDPALGDPHPDLAVLGLESETIDRNARQQTAEVHLWLLPVSGDAQIVEGSVTAGATVEILNIDTVAHTQSGFDWTGEQGSLVALDLDATPTGGIDEVVAVVPPPAESRKPGGMYVFRVEKGAFTVASRANIGADAPYLAPWAARRADVNGDGAPDFYAVFRDTAGMNVRVFFNMKNGQLDPTPVTVPLPPGATLFGATAINADADVQQEIALLTDKGVLLADPSPDGRSFTLAPSAVLPNSGLAIAAGDVNGDGVEDLAIVGNGVLQVFKGVPVLP
jgi:hypothetical protein